MSTLVATHPTLTDTQIHHRVLEELKWDSVVDETAVGVEVDRGIVTLTGTVRSYAEKTAAVEAAHRVRGVLDVANDVEVLPVGSFTRSDTDIAQAVRDALIWDVLVPQDRITTTVAKGWVSLTGNVDTFRQREQAEEAVKNLFGVRGVTNSIQVISSPMRAEQLRTAIEGALERQADREAEDIKIDVADGAVTLTGKVRSWAERRAVVGAAGHAQGVRNVLDHLRVDPYA